MVFLWQLMRVKQNEAQLEKVFFCLCKEIDDVHMVISNEEELFEALGHNC
jgi:hypothetical protein